MRRSSFPILHIQLDSPEKLHRWKQNIKKLFRKVGKHQKEVAIEMSLLAQKQGENVVFSSFISPLSRFCNGKGSAFPTWFQREEERLELLAKSLGFSTTDPLWEVLENTIDYQAPPQEWHNDFPHIHVHIPILFDGKRSGDIAMDYIEQNYGNQTERRGSIYLIGQQKSGKKTAAYEIQQKLLEHQIDLPIVHENLGVPSIVCLEQKPHQIQQWDLVYEMPMWGEREIELLITSFQQEHIDVLALQFWCSKIQESKQWLPFDRRPSSMISYCSSLLTSTITPNRLPQNPKDLRIFLLAKQYEKLELTKLRHVSFDDFCRFCTHCLFRSFGTWTISQNIVQDIFSQFTHDGMIDVDIYDQLNEILHCSANRRKEIVQQLQRSIVPNINNQIAVLLQCGILKESGDDFAFQDQTMMTSFALLGLSNTPISQIPIWTCVLMDEDLRILEEFLLVSDEEINTHLIQKWQQDCPLEFTYDFAWVLLFFALQNRNVFLPQLIQKAWASCLMGMSRQLYIHPQKNQRFVRLLHDISFHFAHILPLLPTSDTIEQLCHPDVLKVFQHWIVPQVVDFRRLSPFQFPPQNILEMEHFMSDITPVWNVLDFWAGQGHVLSQTLLSEGMTYSKWSSIPISIRIVHCGIHEITHRTKQAIQVLILEGFLQNRLYFEDFIRRTDSNILLEIILRFLEPLHICQQFQVQPQKELISFALSVMSHINQFDPFRQSFEDLLQFVDQVKIIEKGRIRHDKRSILVSVNEEELLSHIVEILFEISLIAYELHIFEPMIDLYVLCYKRNFVQKKKIIAYLIQQHDAWIIQYWIDGTDFEQFREGLVADKNLLKKVWKQDIEKKRRHDILMISCLHDPIPNWAISVARDELRYKKQWPNWLSPYRKEAVPLIHLGYESVSIEYRLWWGYQLHRHEPFCSEILQAMQYWLLKEQLPFRDCPAEAQKQIFVTQMPVFLTQDLLNLIRDYANSNSKRHPKWFEQGMLRLWNLCNYENTHQSLIIAKICHQIDLTGQLFDGNWVSAQGSLLRWLTKVWISIQPRNKIKNFIQREDMIGTIIRDHLLEQNDPKVIQYLEHVFLDTGDSIALRKLVVIAKYKPLPLLKKLLEKEPTWKNLLIQVANNMIPISEQSIEIQYWIRQISIVSS